MTESQLLFGTITNLQYLQSGDPAKPYLPVVTLDQQYNLFFPAKDKAAVSISINPSHPDPKQRWARLTIGQQITARVRMDQQNQRLATSSTYLVLGQGTPPEFKEYVVKQGGGSSYNSKPQYQKKEFDVTGMTVGGLFHDAATIEAALIRNGGNLSGAFDINRFMNIYQQLLSASMQAKEELKAATPQSGNSGQLPGTAGPSTQQVQAINSNSPPFVQSSPLHAAAPTNHMGTQTGQEPIQPNLQNLTDQARQLLNKTVDTLDVPFTQTVVPKGGY